VWVAGNCSLCLCSVSFIISPLDWEGKVKSKMTSEEWSGPRNGCLRLFSVPWVGSVGVEGLQVRASPRSKCDKVEVVVGACFSVGRGHWGSLKGW
jgi:hypothetical protein